MICAKKEFGRWIDRIFNVRFYSFSESMKASLFPIQRERRVQQFRKRQKVLFAYLTYFHLSSTEYEELEQPFSFCKGSTCIGRLVPKLLGAYWDRKKELVGGRLPFRNFPHPSHPPNVQTERLPISRTRITNTTKRLRSLLCRMLRILSSHTSTAYHTR